MLISYTNNDIIAASMLRSFGRHNFAPCFSENKYNIVHLGEYYDKILT